MLPASPRFKAHLCAEDTYPDPIDGRMEGGKRGRGAPGKTVVFGMLERDGDVMANVVPDVKKRTLQPVAQANVKHSAAVHTDELRSYAGRNSLFVLTGSEQFRLSNAIRQSLAGRPALLRLLPFSLVERWRTDANDSIDDIPYSGLYPRSHDRKLEPRQALGDYFETYVERDVRRIGEIRNLANFRRFVRLCAGRVGQLANLSSPGADASLSHTTASHWLTVLEASYVVIRLPPFHANIRKCLVKLPKIYFYDVGLASHLIGIEHAGQIGTHPLRGPPFENAVVVEVLKHRLNRGRRSNLSFFRDSSGLECDLLYENGNGMGAIEIKSGATVGSDWFDSLNRVAKQLSEIATGAVVYGGAERQSRRDGEVVPLTDLSELLERLEDRKES